jgi:hypothetical protein
VGSDENGNCRLIMVNVRNVNLGLEIRDSAFVNMPEVCRHVGNVAYRP